jgi:hypothetical protein
MYCNLRRIMMFSKSREKEYVGEISVEKVTTEETSSGKMLLERAMKE